MTWNGDSKNAVNEHFKQVSSIRKAFSYMDKLTIDDVFRSVMMTFWLPSNPLTTVFFSPHDKIMDDLDDDKNLTFAHFQTICVCQFRRRKDRTDPPRDRTDTQLATPRSSPVTPDKYNKFKTQGRCRHRKTGV